MADEEVPICDVLCEAMEYLSKLGSNLRARSESLKEKRIRKDKLKNSHAVQKAADKVLLICELSKKSLENVELGVRRVLNLVQDSYQQGHERRASSTNISKTSDDGDKYQYFKHLSHKLKICKSVPVKHYTSVKVLARSMPMSLQNKYPVYHDCKLYRQRRRQEKVRKSLVVNDSDKRSNDKTLEQKDNLNSLTGNDNSDLSKITDSMKIDETIEVDKKSFGKENKANEATTELSKDKDPKYNKTNKDDNVISQTLDSSSESSNETIKSCIKKKDGSSNKVNFNSENEESTKQLKQQRKRKYKHIQVFDDSSESSNELPTIKELKDSKVVNNYEEAEYQGFAKTSCSEQKLVSSHITEKEENKDPKPEDDRKSTVNDEEEKAIRPVIKCVSLTKLLKPDVLEKIVEPKDIAKRTTKSDNSKDDLTSKKQIVSQDKTIIQIAEKSTKDDVGFWTVKREEVRSFKPKKFTVDVNRLPKITLSFLKYHSLKKITQDNAIICELNEKDSETDTGLNKENIVPSSSEEPKNIKINTTEKIDKVKSALLNDTDSEKSDSNSINLEEIVNTVNSALLDMSLDDINDDINPKTGSEVTSEKNKESEKDTVDEASIENNLLLNDVDNNEQQKNTEKEVQSKLKQDISKNPDIVNFKNALLCDSDSDSNLKEKEKDVESIKKYKSKEKENNSCEVKQSLLIESDSDEKNESLPTPTNNNEINSTVDQSNSEEANQINKSLHNESDPDKLKESNAQKSEETFAENFHSKENEAENLEEKNTFEDELEIPLSRKRKRKDSNTPKKKKHVKESLHAKKMLLHYSSSSDTEDELLKNALQEIKDSLLDGISSDDEKAAKDLGTGKESGSSESEDGDFNKNQESKAKKSKKESKTQEAEKESQDSEDNVSKNSDEDSEAEISKSCRSKMGRSRAHPGGSGQNSDSQEAIDKHIDGLTNLNSLMKNRRRRDSSTPEKTDSNSGRKTEKIPKTPLISEENMLKADSSSEAASEVDSDVGEDLPPVSLPGLNGSGIEHLAKDDLLDESDSSNQSHNEVEEAVKNDSDEDHNPKSKRRKPHAISSDSEAGGSRTKTRDVDARLSDFDESDDDNSATKKSKRKKKVDDSDASGGSSSNDGRKKRRRIKLLNDSDGSGSDTENEGKNKHGRKNIRKVMGKNQLEEATKKAARQEKERIARIADRQKLYNNLEFDESGKPDEVVLEKVVLDFDPETKEPLIEVDRGLVKKLKPHQANGIKFMWDACFESVKRMKKDKGSGCILAHCMGLGKTLQVVSLTHTLLTHSHLTKVNRVLVVCPLSTVLNWVNEFNMWLKHSIKDYEVDVYELSRYKQNSERAFQLSQWVAHGGVCVLGYEMFRNLSADNNKKFKKKMLKHFQEALVDPGPDMVVCDEGHLLKNEKTSLSQSMNRVRTLRRIVLTGTPLQNNLKEYYCMVQFVKPNLLGKYNEYLNRFVNPITNGQYTDSTEHDIRIMKRRSHVLHKMLDGAVQRRDYGVLAPFLPPKHEYVLFITLTEVQIKLYQFYLDNYSRRPLPGKSSGFLFPDFQSLQRIWTHPLVLKYNSERYEIMQQKKRDKEEEEDSEGSLADFIDDDSTPDESSTEESSDDLSDVSDDSRKKNKKKKAAKKNKGKESKTSTRRGTRANPASQFEQTVELNNDEEPVPEAIEMKAENPTEWWIKLVTEDEIDDMKNSHKLILLFDILRQCDAIGDKLLVFSQSLYSLDLIEHFLGKVDEATQEGRIDDKLAGHVGSWSPGVDYFRLDGSTSCENRSIWCKNFNREDNPRARLFLISTRAGGLGINLVAANRVVIFDVSWNPSHDVQSIFRVYRFGQKKPCYVYRFLAMGTMEEKIYERQVTKQAISKRVIDEQQIDRHYAENDLAELYKFEPRPPVPRPLPPLPKDRLFAEMLREHEAQIYKYHEHDSLLENKEEETLSEEERKAAWEDFENEKNRPPPAPFPTAWPMHNGMMPGLLAQQQQLAYAALAAMLRKDMPNINDNTIRDMLPHIYNANPALMQKITELYKYAPPGGMMNPGMMNPVMNAGSGATGNMGGTSGLQYEPPWQRQHQQQQQMRLQQLMQHQNQMGAKYYAGGLGSRDPVAMALQQQRAREMQAGDTRARPRGRPPLQPRAPLAPHADVVNLDSD